jgi:hypothetical protein
MVSLLHGGACSFIDVGGDSLVSCSSPGQLGREAAVYEPGGFKRFPKGFQEHWEAANLLVCRFFVNKFVRVCSLGPGVR